MQVVQPCNSRSSLRTSISLISFAIGEPAARETPITGCASSAKSLLHHLVSKFSEAKSRGRLICVNTVVLPRCAPLAAAPPGRPARPGLKKGHDDGIIEQIDRDFG